MKFFKTLFKPSVENRQGASMAGEPLVTCFGCHRAEPVPRLTPFPWWDEVVNEFGTMYRCDSCLPKARRHLLKQLAKDDVLLERFVAFAGESAIRSREGAPDSRRGEEALAYAKRVLEGYGPRAATPHERRI